MPYKSRTKSNELIILELLNGRTTLVGKDKQHYFNLKKGYEGEVLFDRFTEKLQCEYLILNDLLLELNSTTFQIDSLIIAQGKIYFYEIKNYEGDYYYESDKLFKKEREIEVINPLFQLSRSESLLSQLLRNHGFNPQIDASVVFINSKFTLYQAPLDKPIIFPTQVQSYLNNLNAEPSKLTPKYKQIGERLMALNKTNSPYQQIPSYEYGQLRKGTTCGECHSFSVSVEKRKCVCKECGYEEPVTNAVIRSIKEFKILFPKQKVTTNVIYDWCRVVECKKRIRRILASNFAIVGNQKWTYYK